MTLVAKPIVKNHLWVITDGGKKVGNIEANSNATSYSVRIGNDINYFSSTKNIEQDIQLVFASPIKTQALTQMPFARWPTESKTYNNFYDIKRKIHVYTTSKKSKCYHAAGYFNIELNGEWQTLFSPKYIFIQRYKYDGPYKTIEEAERYHETNQLSDEHK